MNSFNHYVFGAIGDWLYSVVAGIREDADHPGYKRMIIKPEPGASLSFARAKYQSLYGTIHSSWEVKEKQIHIRVQIPPNTTGELHLPQDDGSFKTVEIGSGTHDFAYDYNPQVPPGQ
jgi:alpha-L-rhamnosidase